MKTAIAMFFTALMFVTVSGCAHKPAVKHVDTAVTPMPAPVNNPPPAQ